MAGTEVEESALHALENQETGQGPGGEGLMRKRVDDSTFLVPENEETGCGDSGVNGIWRPRHM